MTGHLNGKTIKNILALAAGVVVEDIDGVLYSWGLNSYGQLAQDTTTNYYSPRRISSINTPSMISNNGVYHLMAVFNNKLYTWGRNSEYQLNTGDDANRKTPTEISFPYSIKQISTGYYSSYVLTEEGDIYSWGQNTYGQLGNGTTTDVKAGQTKVINPEIEIAKLLIDGEEVDYELIDSKTIKLISPPHSIGKVDFIVIDNEGSQWILADAYEYVDQQTTPEISNENIEVPNTGNKSSV